MSEDRLASNWHWNLLASIIVGLFVYYYLYPRYKNRDLTKSKKEAKEKEVINNLYQIYQQYNNNQEEIITVPEPDVNNLNYMIDSYNPHPSLPKEMEIYFDIPTEYYPEDAEPVGKIIFESTSNNKTEYELPIKFKF